MRSLFSRFGSRPTLAIVGGLVIVVIACCSYVLNAQRQAKITSSTGKLKAIGVALHAYYETYKSLPPAWKYDAEKKNKHSWRVLLLEFLDNETYRLYRLDEPWDSKANRKIEAEGARFYCMNESDYRSFYYVVTGDATPFKADGGIVRIEAISQIANTIAIVESATVKAHWMEPIDLKYETMSFIINDMRNPSISSNFSDKPLACLFDCLVNSIDQNTTKEALQAQLQLPPSR